MKTIGVLETREEIIKVCSQSIKYLFKRTEGLEISQELIDEFFESWDTLSIFYNYYDPESCSIYEMDLTDDFAEFLEEFHTEILNND